MMFYLILSVPDFLFFLCLCFMFPFIGLIHFFGVITPLLVFERRIRPLDDIVSHFFRVLASLNLPAAIEDISGDTVPQSILTKSTSVIEQGGIQTVDQLIKELPELLQRKLIMHFCLPASDINGHFISLCISDFCLIPQG